MTLRAETDLFEITFNFTEQRYALCKLRFYTRDAIKLHDSAHRLIIIKSTFFTDFKNQFVILNI